MKIGDDKMSYYEELIEKRNKLAEEIRNLDQEIEKQEKMQAQNTVVDIIQKLEELKTYDPFAILPIEVFCEECETDIDSRIDFDELIQLFEDYKERV